jgi:hypothetical protein
MEDNRTFMQLDADYSPILESLKSLMAEMNAYSKK